jgi:hypothetical protein
MDFLTRKYLHNTRWNLLLIKSHRARRTTMGHCIVLQESGETWGIFGKII